jgi:tagatose-1,6-bisphosphate aldolase
VTYPVMVMPPQIVCGKCGNHMRCDRDKLNIARKFAIVECVKIDCEQHDIPLVFPLEVREMERAET